MSSFPGENEGVDGYSNAFAPVGARGTLNVPSRSAGWAAVDRNAEPARFAAFLAGYGADEAVQAHRARCLSLLDPSPGETVLDIGCGAGEDARMLAARVGDGLVVGCDRSRELVRLAPKAGGPAVRFIVGDARALPLADGVTDVVWIERVLQHLADPAAAIAEAVRVLRPGGRVLVTEPDWLSLRLEVTGGPGAVSRAVVRHVAEDVRSAGVGAQLAALCATAGLRVTDTTDLDLRITDGRLVDTLLALRLRVLELCALSEIDDAAAHGWIDALRAGTETGGFSLEMRCNTVLGRRPGET